MRRDARREVLTLAAAYLAERGQPLSQAVPADAIGRPWVVTGHQPELFHPGVWVKNFALAAQAKQLGGVGLHLVADHDTLKSPTLRLPTGFDSGGPLRLRRVPFDALAGESPYETRRVLDRVLWDSFPERVAELTRGWGYEPMLLRLWPPAPDGPVGERFAALRRGVERSWGVENLELPVSRLAGTEAFRRFACHVCRDLPRFAASYNAAIRDYRRRNGLRSKHHPAPELEARGASIEAPFWRLGPAGERRRPFHDPHTVPDLAGLRPRALTLTLFARLVLADDFLHGVGGGKYDEVTDAILADYFGVAPPAYQVWTATLFLPIAGAAGRLAPGGPSPAEWAATWRAAEWNPAHALPEAVRAEPTVAALLAERAALLAESPASKAARHRRFFQVRAATASIREAARPLLGEWERGAELAKRAEADRAVVEWREASWAMYPEAELREFLTGAANGTFAPPSGSIP